MDIAVIVLAALVLVCSVVTLVLVLKTRDAEQPPASVSGELLKTVEVINNQNAARTAEINKQNADSMKDMRDATAHTLEKQGNDLVQFFDRIRQENETQSNRITTLFEKISRANEEQLTKVRESNRTQLDKLQTENSASLEKIRESVDEKLSKTLNERLEQSFKLVTQQLDTFSQNIGTMKVLTTNVNDLQKTLSGVKTRGNWGEVQLESILSDMLTPDQYERQSRLGRRGQGETVDFAIILPEGADGKTYLPIDSKFPLEDYQRLCDAAEPEEAERARKGFIAAIKKQAYGIKEKYIVPEKTTEFAIMYVPTEGIYAEILRNGGLVEDLQNNCRVVPAGPTNLAALVSSLRMGFKTLALQKNVHEVVRTLSAFRKTFESFGGILEKTRGNISRASDNLDDLDKKTQTIQSKLKNLDTMLPEDAADPPRLLED